MTLKIISTENAPGAIGTYSQAVVVDNTLYLSGQIGLDPKNSELKKTFKEQLIQIFKNIEAVLGEAGTTKNNIFKTTIFLKNLDDFNDVNEFYENYFSRPYPARSCVEVSKLPMNSLIEIEVMAKI